MNKPICDPRNEEDINSLMIHVLHGMFSMYPLYAITMGAYRSYIREKRGKQWQEEVNLFMAKIEQEIKRIEIKQEGITYFETSIIIHEEDILHKLATNPGKGFAEILAEFITNALQDLKTPPETKDFILATLLHLDHVDILVLKTLDKHLVSNLPNHAEGVTRDSICTLLKYKKIDLEEAIIDRSLQRLQSEALVQPMRIHVPGGANAITAEEIYQGKRPDQYNSPGGFVNTSFGRIFINFLKLAD